MLRLDSRKLDTLMNPYSDKQNKKKSKQAKMLRGEGVTGQEGEGIMGTRKILNSEIDLNDGFEK